MPETNAIRLYLFEGVPVFTDVSAESELYQSPALTELRVARRQWRRRHHDRDPRYLVFVEGFAFGSSTMQRCPYCENERPRVCECIVCGCTVNT